MDNNTQHILDEIYQKQAQLKALAQKLKSIKELSDSERAQIKMAIQSSSALGGILALSINKPKKLDKSLPSKNYIKYEKD